MTIEIPKIPIGEWVEELVDWINTYFGWLLDGITAILQFMVDLVLGILLLFPPPVLILILCGLAWYIENRRKLKEGLKTKDIPGTMGLALITLAGLLLIWDLRLWDASMETLALVIVSTMITLVIGIPLGILTAKHDRMEGVMRVILDFMQTMPSFVYLIPAVIFFGLGNVPGIIATVVFAMPPAIRLTNLGLRQIPKELKEVADAFGSTARQKLLKVEIPVAMPTIMAGVNQCIMLALSMTVIASMIGAKGLGYQVLYGIQRIEIGVGFEAGLAIVIIAIILDRMTQHMVPSYET